jgi:MFS family permease
MGGIGFTEISMSTIVLFGGLMGALYSLLQFIAAPIWGKISDIVGRKPVLIISLIGLFISYVIWFFSGNFTLLIIARALGGLMSGNLSIASAVVADVTDVKNRSKGMAVIGIAFALGFILGPAIGGISTLFNLVKMNPALGIIGVNPFSVAALVASVLTLFNLIFVIFFFPETLPREKRGQNTGLHRTLNIFKLFKPLPYSGANKTNIAYFFFITAFAGMEFTLTFLAVERFQYSAMDNAYMFIFIGFFIGMVQGGYVRRKAHQVGENKMAIQGIIAVIPGLILLAMATSTWMLYLGLFFLAVGSAMIIPCMTSLVSLFTPFDQQGHALGIFRSLGSLGRVFGPISAALIYWRFGGKTSYLIGALLMLLPLVIMKFLPPLPENSSDVK